MKKCFTVFTFSLLSLSLLFGQNTLTVDPNEDWIGYMDVFNLGDFYEFGSFWALPDVKSVVDPSSGSLTLYPNFSTYDPSDEYWVTPTGEGNKLMIASTFFEPGPGFNGTDLTFTGSVDAFTLDTSYTAKFFIKALDPANNYSDFLNGSLEIPLPTSGTFTASAAADQLPAGLIIQCGFSITGINANPAHEDSLGNVVVTSGTVSVKVPDEMEATVYPNPVGKVLSIRSTTPVQSFQIMNLAGQQVLRGEGSQDVDVSDLPAGVYTILLEGKERKKAMSFRKE